MAECALGCGTGATKLRLFQQAPTDLPRDANGHAIQNDRLWALRFDSLFGFFTPADASAPEATQTGVAASTRTSETARSQVARAMAPGSGWPRTRSRR